jgi:hypothetical protein
MTGLKRSEFLTRAGAAAAGALALGRLPEAHARAAGPGYLEALKEVYGR